MGRLPRVFLAVLLAAPLALPASPGQAVSLPDPQALEGLDSITINASTGPKSPPECGSTAAVVRNAVAGRVAQAGLKPADGASLVANVQAATLGFDRNQVCVSSVTLRIGLFAFYYIDPVEKKERLGEVALVNKSGMLTTDAATHPQQVTALIHRMLDEFLLDWREANLVAQMGKVAPAAGVEMTEGERATYAQRRLAALGFYAGAIDGIIGPGTARAITSFQKANGLGATGELDEPTYEALTR